MEIRPASLSDLPAINQVIESAIMVWDLPERVKYLSLSSYQYDEQDFSHMRIFIAENNRQEISAVSALDETDSPESGENESALLLHGIYVKSGRHRQGIGQALFTHAENQVRAADKTGLLVKAQPGAVEFFKAQGMIKLPVQDKSSDYPYLFWKRI